MSNFVHDLKKIDIKTLKKLIRWIVGIVLGVYIGIIILFSFSAVQETFASVIADELSKTLNTEVLIKRVNLGFLNRIIINDLTIKDQKGKSLLKATRLAAKFEWKEILQGRIVINSVQLFSFNINIDREKDNAPLNCQFILDKLSSKEESEGSIDLRINAILVRRGNISYDLLSSRRKSTFDPNHIRLRNLQINAGIRIVREDSMDIFLKKMSFNEECSGIDLRKLSFRLNANPKEMNLDELSVGINDSRMDLKKLALSYPSYEKLAKLDDKVKFTLNELNGEIRLSDFKKIVPELDNYDNPIRIRTDLKGNPRNIVCERLSADNSELGSLLTSFSLRRKEKNGSSEVFARINRINLKKKALILGADIADNKGKLRSLAQRLDHLYFSGELFGPLDDLSVNGSFRTGVGTVYSDVRLGKTDESLAFSGKIRSADFKLGKLLNNDDFGLIALDVTSSGKITGNQPLLHIKGKINDFDFKRYRYNNIQLDGQFSPRSFDGKLLIDDPNIYLSVNGMMQPSLNNTLYDCKIELKHCHLDKLNLTDKKNASELAFNVNASLQGKGIDNITGYLKVDHLNFSRGEHIFQDKWLIADLQQRGEQEKSIDIRSDFMKLGIDGSYTYKYLPNSLMRILNRYLPALQLPVVQQPESVKNKFHLKLELLNLDMVAALLKIPVQLNSYSKLEGYIDDSSDKISINGFIPDMRYDGKHIESANFTVGNTGENLTADIHLIEQKRENAMDVTLKADCRNDSIRTRMFWGNNEEQTYSGELNAVTSFRNASADGNGRQYITTVDIKPSHAIISDSIWSIAPSRIIVEKGKMEIESFSVSHNQRFLKVSGTVSESPKDTVRMQLNNINIGYVFDVLDLGVDFKGEATGPAIASGVLKTPVMKTDLFIKDLSLNDGLLGDAQIHGEWKDEVKAIALQAKIKEKDKAYTEVNGFIYPLKPVSALDLHIRADRTNLKFIHEYMKSVTSEFEARVSGDVRLYGKFKALTLNGTVDADAYMKIDETNVTYHVQDTIIAHPNGIIFKNNRLYDRFGKAGMLKGEMSYNHFKDIKFNLDIEGEDLLMMDLKEKPTNSFYGQVFGSGKISIAGDVKGININADVRTRKNSTFTYIKDYINTAASNNFIQFVDKTPKRITSDYEKDEETEQEIREPYDVRLNLQVEVTPDALMRVIMDPVSKDYIQGRGHGNIRADFYDKDELRLFGSYKISQGLYKFSIEDLIHKDFIIKDGSSITFNGLAQNAMLDINANYIVASASLNDLIPNAKSIVSQTNVKVNCTMNLSGQLTAPTFKLGIDFPNEREEIKSLVRSYIPTDEKMSLQMLYLLSIGKFYTPDNMESQNSNMMSNVVSSTLSGQLNNALSHILNSSNWNVGTYFSTGEKGWSDVEFEGVLSGQLLNNRLIVNGNFGYRDNPLANTNFVGDVVTEFLLNRSGDIRLKAFNVTNDRYYKPDNFTTQGVAIIFRKDFNIWNELFFWKRWRMKHKKESSDTKKK